jgi:hypothetical protein
MLLLMFVGEEKLYIYSGIDGRIIQCNLDIMRIYKIREKCLV